MAISDLWKKPKKEELLTVHGSTGTDIMSGMIDEEYNADLQFPQSIEMYDEMRKSDGTVAAILRAIKNPITSAEWEIIPGGEDEQDKKIAEFVERNMFEKIKFQSFLREGLGFLDFGFYYFEKVFEIVNGMIEWKEFSPRIPSAHFEWGIRGQEWENGHPAGVTQQLNRTDDQPDKENQPTIPWNKLILFTNEMEGNNYGGVSILRGAYKHYHYKNLCYKVSAISAERYGTGVPYAKVKSSMKETNRDKVEEFLKNIRSNEKSYACLTDEVIEFEIKTPNGTGVGTQIESLINHHDKKMYDSILAGFLNLTSGEGGSNALSKDQSSFFLRGLQGVADYFVDEMNRHIKELVDLNFNGVKNYPELFVSEIGQTSMDENINAIGTAKEKGLITYTIEDEITARNILKLPFIEREELQKIRDEAIANAPVIPEVVSEKPEKKLAEDDKKKVPTKREITFTKNITDFEKYIEGKYEEAVAIIEASEKEYQDVLVELYTNSKSERVDGVVCLLYDKAKITEGKNKINKITARLEKKLIDSKIQDDIFEQAIAQAKSTLEKNDQLLSWSLDIPQGQVNTFIDGYKSNMQGVIFNESRRVLENITLNYGSEASVELAINGAKQVTFNRNIVALSFVTHPRALYKFVIFDESIGQGFTLFKPIVPTTRYDDLLARPFGATA